jgi:DNA-binding IclR family transcriptional regulator
MAEATVKEQITLTLRTEGAAGLTTKELAQRISKPEPSVRRTVHQMVSQGLVQQSTYGGEKRTRNKQTVWVLASSAQAQPAA